MRLIRPPSPQQAQQLADRLGPLARYLAGATAVQQEWPEPRLAPTQTTFIDVMGWPQTQQITLAEQGLRIGAAARLETVRCHSLVRHHAPLLCEALSQLGAPGVRRLGTLGGNVGWGEGDCGPVLLALDAQVELADGVVLPLEALAQRASRPLMVAFWLPRADRRALGRCVFEKVGYRAAFSPARIRLALRWSPGDAQIVRVAAAAPGTPLHRLHAVETVLARQAVIPPDLQTIRAACRITLPADLALMASRLIAGHHGCLGGV